MIKHSITLRQLIHTLWTDRWLILVCTLIVASTAVGYALTRKPVYQSDALLAPAKSDSSQLGALSAVAGQLAGLSGLVGLSMPSGDVDEAVAILKSRQFTDAFIVKHEVSRYLFPDHWDSSANRWKRGAAEQSWIASSLSALTSSDDPQAAGSKGGAKPKEGPSPEDAFKRFERLRDVVVDRRTSYVKLSVRAPTAQLADDWASAMIADLNETMRTSALQEASVSVDVLAKKIQSEQIESIRNTSATLLEGQLQRQLLAEVRKEFALRVLDAPNTPEQRVYPRRTRMVAIGIALGFVLGCALSLVRQASRRRRANLT